jgi:hypothetical protein
MTASASAPGLAVRYRSLAELQINPRNARRHSRSQIAALKKAIQEFGFRVPVLIDETGMVMAGHGRLEAARLLGLEKVPTICLEGLTQTQKRAFVLADNRLAELGSWDRGELNLELEALSLSPCNFDLSVTGFSFPTQKSSPPRNRHRPRQSASKPRSWRIGRHVVRCLDPNDEEALGAVLKAGPTQFLTEDGQLAERLVALLKAEGEALGGRTKTGNLNERSNTHA